MPRESTRKKSTAATKPSPATKSAAGGFGFDFSKFMSSPQLNNSPPKSRERSAVAKVDTSSATVSSISELKDMASSKLESVKRHLDRSHAHILKDFDASQSRLNKRLKLRTQGCQQLMDEAEKEYKEMSDRIGEGREAMKDSYSEFMTELQASSSRVFKASLPELSQSFGKAIDSLKSRYGVV